MKKLILIVLSVLILTAMCISISADSYYTYDDKMSTIGMKLTSALYLSTSSDDYVSITGITRVDTGSSPYYSTITLYSEVSYSYFVSSDESYVVGPHENELVVNTVGSNKGYFVPEHGYEDAVSSAVFGFGYHSGYAENSSGTRILTKNTTGSDATRFTAADYAEIRRMMS